MVKSSIRLFDPPVPVPSRHGAAIVVTVATWALLVLTVPLYFVFLLNSLPDVFAIVSNMRAPRHSTARDIDADQIDADEIDADEIDADAVGIDTDGDSDERER